MFCKIVAISHKTQDPYRPQSLEFGHEILQANVDYGFSKYMSSHYRMTRFSTALKVASLCELQGFRFCARGARHEAPGLLGQSIGI